MFWYRFLAFSPKHLARNCTLPVRFRFGNRAKEGKKRAGGVGFSYPQGEILHPILHPKLPGFIGVSHPGCRKCRRFSENFFYGREEECRNVFYTKEDGNSKTSDFFGQKYGGFALKVRMFYAKKSDVFNFRMPECFGAVRCEFRGRAEPRGNEG